MSLTVKDLENLQAQYPDYRLELVKGKIIVMSPSGYESDEVAFRFGANLWNWVEPRQLGRITGSSAGFSLANTRAPREIPNKSNEPSLLLSYVDQHLSCVYEGSLDLWAFIVAPDVSFIRAERLPRSPRGYATIPPDLMVEVKSPTDRVDDLRDKIDEFLAQGTVVGILVNPEERTVEIRRLNQAPIVLQDGDVLTVSDLLPGWQVPVSELWSPVFG